MPYLQHNAWKSLFTDHKTQKYPQSTLKEPKNVYKRIQCLEKFIYRLQSPEIYLETEKEEQDCGDHRHQKCVEELANAARRRQSRCCIGKKGEEQAPLLIVALKR